MKYKTGSLETYSKTDLSKWSEMLVSLAGAVLGTFIPPLHGQFQPLSQWQRQLRRNVNHDWRTEVSSLRSAYKLAMWLQPSLQQAPKKNALFRAFPRHTCSISLWKDYLPTLRTQMHNAPIYCNITKKFIEGASGSGDGAIFATVKQLRHKLENLTQRGVWELQKGKTQTTKEEPLVVWSSPSKIQESGQSERGVLFRMVKERQSLR